MALKSTCCLLVGFQLSVPQCWLYLSGVEALKRKPPVLRPSPTVLSLAGYLAAAAASALTAVWLMPSEGKAAATCAGLRMINFVRSAVHGLGRMLGSQPM